VPEALDGVGVPPHSPPAPPTHRAPGAAGRLPQAAKLPGGAPGVRRNRRVLRSLRDRRSRTHDQMVQAGTQRRRNIARADGFGHSRRWKLKLTGCAPASRSCCSTRGLPDASTACHLGKKLAATWAVRSVPRRHRRRREAPTRTHATATPKWRQTLILLINQASYLLGGSCEPGAGLRARGRLLRAPLPRPNLFQGGANPDQAPGMPALRRPMAMRSVRRGTRGERASGVAALTCVHRHPPVAERPELRQPRPERATGRGTEGTT
jgi:hypothetical protein